MARRLLLTLMLLIAALPAQAAGRQGAVVTIDGPIGPATARYVADSLERAKAENMALVILEIDTPGGLGRSMHQIVKAILASPVPVIGYVSPSGARAASAGTYILYATAIAAMAPATNVGAATPVSLFGGGGRTSSKASHGSSVEHRKVLNDAVAFIRSLAERHGRNADWAEHAVRAGASLSAREALKRNVVNLVSPDIHSLVVTLNGHQALAAGRLVRLDTSDLSLVHYHPGWRTRAVSVITQPTVAYVLMLVGLLGIFLELVIPGTFVPGTIGLICLLLAAYAFQILPVNYAGLGLIAVGVGLMIAEAVVPTFGALGIGGIVAFVAGSVLLMDTNIPGYRISMALIAGIAIAAALALGALIFVLWRSRRTPPATGNTGMVGTAATALENMDDEGWVRAHGEQWRARTRAPVRRGQTLRIVAVDGLTLVVEPEENGEGERCS